MATIEDFEKLDVRIGKIVEVEDIPNPKFSVHKLTIDFGDELGQKKSCARTIVYKKEDLLGKLVLCVVNFPPRQIGKNMSEVLTLGIPDGNGECRLIGPDKDVPLGGRLY